MQNWKSEEGPFFAEIEFILEAGSRFLTVPVWPVEGTEILAAECTRCKGPAYVNDTTKPVSLDAKKDDPGDPGIFGFICHLCDPEKLN